ncbi:hypothetical protein D039_0663B, partial [Vibrio parahaemolyticus EKP-028]
GKSSSNSMPSFVSVIPSIHSTNNPCS